MGDGGYIGYAGASSTEVSVVADIAEGLDISGFTPAISVSSIPEVVVAIMPAMSVSAMPTTTVNVASFPVNQNVSGVTLDTIAVESTAIKSSTASGLGMSNQLLATIDSDTGNILADTDTINNNIGVLTASGVAKTNANLLAIESLNTSGFTTGNQLLTTIDSDTGNILADTDTINNNIGVLTASGVAKTNANLLVIGGYLNDVEGSLDAIETNGDHMEVLNASGFGSTNQNLASIKASVAKLDDIKDAVETIDNAISGNEMQVDVLTMPTVVANISAFPATTGITGGGAESGSQRVTIANDSTGSVGIKPSTSAYLSHVYIDLDAAGDNPATNTEVIAAGGADTKLVIYGIQGSIVGSAAAAAGNWYLSDGNTSAATTLWTGRAQGLTNTMFELTFPYGVALTTNTALKVTSTEAANNIFINAVVYYRTEAT